MSMEPNCHVLTTTGCWSQLIDGSRTNVVDQRHHSCAKVHHLQKPDNEKKQKKKKKQVKSKLQQLTNSFNAMQKEQCHGRTNVFHFHSEQNSFAQPELF